MFVTNERKNVRNSISCFKTSFFRVRIFRVNYCYQVSIEALTFRYQKAVRYHQCSAMRNEKCKLEKLEN